MAIVRIFLITIIAFCNLLAQDSTLQLIDLSGKAVREIKIFGNEVTLDRIILREMRLGRDSLLTWQELNRDRERLENLQLFSSIALYPVEAGDSVDLHILLQERKRWFFFPIVFYDERNGWMYGGGGVNNNFRGRDEILYLNIAVGGETYAQFWFNDPWVLGDHISFDARVEINSFDNTYEDFYQRQKSLRFALGGWINETRKWTVYFGYRQVRSDRTGKTISPHNLDQNPFIGLNWVFDYRDLYVNTHSGSYIGFTVEYAIPLSERQPNEQNFLADLRWFLPFTDRMRLAMWNIVYLSRGKVPEYRFMHLGGSNTIRGWELNSRKGASAWYASLEMRYDILPKRVITEGIDLGLGGLLFADGGCAFPGVKGLSFGNSIFSAGIGLRIFFPIVDEIRFAYGWRLNESGAGFTFNTNTRF